MSDNRIDINVHIDNTPDAVMSYIADVRNRPLYLPQLKAVDDIQGGPGKGTTWRWTFSALGLDFVGTGRCLDYQPGKLYRFETEGGIKSTWTYQAGPDGSGTKLAVQVDYEVPERARPVLPIASVFAPMRQAGAQKAAENLKAILDQ